MGHKTVCIDCRKSFNRVLDKSMDRIYPCSECGKPMTILPHRFRPPKKADDVKWETVKYLVENGFYYQHVFKSLEFKNKKTSNENYVNYPDNIRDAKEFVERYKQQALK